LAGTITVKTRDDKSVDLDVDLSSFDSALHRHAYELLGNTSNSDLSEAKACLNSQLILNPTNNIAHYNLSCAESLVGNLTESLSSLKDAIQNGFTDALKITSDPDLKALHSLPEFKELLSTLANYTSSCEPQQPTRTSQLQAEPEPVPEPQHEPKQEPPQTIQNEPSVEPPTEPKKWERELKVFAEMGFLDESILVQTLNETGGNVEQVLTNLLG